MGRKNEACLCSWYLPLSLYILMNLAYKLWLCISTCGVNFVFYPLSATHFTSSPFALNYLFDIASATSRVHWSPRTGTSSTPTNDMGGGSPFPHQPLPPLACIIQHHVWSRHPQVRRILVVTSTCGRRKVKGNERECEYKGRDPG